VDKTKRGPPVIKIKSRGRLSLPSPLGQLEKWTKYVTMNYARLGPPRKETITTCKDFHAAVPSRKPNYSPLFSRAEETETGITRRPKQAEHHKESSGDWQRDVPKFWPNTIIIHVRKPLQVVDKERRRKQS
jgi:hypothetical protein